LIQHFKRMEDIVIRSEGIGCAECDIFFPNLESLSEHHSYEHLDVDNGSLDYSCKEIMVHCCDYCDYRATRRWHLKVHVESKHENVRYTCKVCNYHATTKGNLRRHERKCKVCKGPCSAANHSKDSKTKYSVDSKDEVRVQTTYFCDKCDYRTKQKPHLNQHKVSIHENKVYSCDECSYKATFKGNLKRHIKTFHGAIINEVVNEEEFNAGFQNTNSISSSNDKNEAKAQFKKGRVSDVLVEIDRGKELLERAKGMQNTFVSVCHNEYLLGFCELVDGRLV